MVNRTVLAYRAGARVARLLPERVAIAAADRIGAMVGRRAGARREQVERNLRRVYGHDLSREAIDRGVRETFGSYARYWIESFRLPDVTPATLDAGMSIEGWDNVVAGRERGKGVILALPHLGGWEWGGFWLTRVKQVPVSVVVEPLEPPEMFEWFAAFREALGLHVIALGPSAGTRVLQALKANHVVCLLCDRDLHGDGIDVEFFGERTTLPAGPATLSLRTGAPLLPAAMYYEPPGHAGVIRPPVDTSRTGRLRDDVARVTQALARELETLVRHAPEQWHMLQPNWPSDRAPAA
jgi:KDO2-lipid IV(A) lauroyltransferase